MLKDLSSTINDLSLTFHQRSTTSAVKKKNILFPTTFVMSKGIMKSWPTQLPESHCHCNVHIWLCLILSKVNKRFNLNTKIKKKKRNELENTNIKSK